MLNISTINSNTTTEPNKNEPNKNQTKNKGSILDGLGYVGASLLAGVGGVGEGIIDLLLAGGGLLTGNVDYAKHVFKDNTVGDWYADVTEDFNPGTGWEFAGNVMHGLGQSSVFLLNLIPGLGQLGTAAFFAGVGSQGISSAAETTGDVGFKEVAYGVASGAVEGALEKAFGGMGKAVKALGGSTMKNITKTAVRKGLVKQVLSDAAGEFGEEFASEYIDTFLQRGFQIDPNKQYSFRDALYAGAVGFTSGAVSAGSANVLKAKQNERVGDRIVKSGNSQTLVNTATKVADKLAAQVTNWDRAGEWIKALRGQVDAYSKLSESERTGMRGKTILGEMKSSLFFAETQSTFNLVKKSIQDSDEQTRATFAEYINRSVEKSKRNGRDYTAADIAKDTDGVAWQLAIYKFVPSLFDIDGALADMQQESGIADVIARNQGAESGVVVGADPVAVGAEQYDLVGKDVNGNEIYETSEDTKKLPRKQRMRKFVDIMNNEYYGRTAKFTVDGETYYARFDQKDVNKNVYGDRRSDRKGYNAKIDVGADGNIFELVENAKYQDSRAESGKSTDAHKNVSEWDYFDKTVIIDGTQYDVLINIRKKDNGEYVYSVQLRESKKEASSSSRAHYDNSHSSNKEDDASSGGRTPPASVNTLAGTSKTSGRSSTDNSIHQNESVVNPEAKEISSDDASDEKGKNSRSEAVSVEGEQTGAETVQDETTGASPSPTDEFNGEVDLERAKRDAERIIEWERKEAPTVDELNSVRGAVRNFDSLSSDRQRAIVRMVRSGKNIDESVIRAVSNIMAITNKKGAVLAPDVEIRFAEFGKDSTRRGIKTEVGGKTVIVLNANATYKDSIRGSIAHEIVHYLENRKGYKALADFAMKHAKAEKVAQVRETYKDVYKGENAEAKIEAEVVASVVAELLGSEKFLKGYAQMGEEQGSVVKRIAKFVKGIANALKDKDDKASAVAAKMMDLVDRALGSEVAGEKTGEKYSYAGEKAETADKMTLAHAKQMLSDGVDGEAIRKETGWFKGYDGKWRFEIDDFESGLIENPKLERHEDDGEIFFTGKLTDIFNHDALFKAYPELKNINIVIQKTEFGVYGIFQPNSNYITLSIEHFKRTTKEYHDYANGGRKAEIERIEATPEFQEYNSFYDKDADDIIDAQEWLRQEQELRDRFFSSELGKRYYQLMWGKSGFTGNKYEFGWGTGGKETLLHELQHAIQNIEGFASGTSTRDPNYSRNAGELEAYDTERRTNLTAEERKNTRPDIDREDVVFAEGVSYYQASSIDEDEDVKSIRQQLKNAKDKLAEIAPAKSKYPPRAFKNAKEALDWAVNILKASGQLIQRQGYGDIVLDEKRLKNGLSYLKTDAEKVAFSLIPKVIKNGIEIGRHPKHKGRNYDTVTFALPVTVGNKTGNMAVVIREEGKKYFKLHRVFMPDGSLFEFTETKKSNAETAGLQNANLSPTNVASNNSIHQNEPIVNTSDKKSSDKEQYDLDPEAVEREAKRLTPKTDVKGQEMSDKFFEAAVARAYEEANLSAEEKRQLAQERNKEAVEKRKTKFDKLLGKAYSIQKKVDKIEKTVGQDVDEAELKKLKKQYRDVLGEMAGLQVDLRQMGYDLNAEQRLIERQQKQIENQSREIGDLRAYKRNNERLERETSIIKDMESKEAARQARLYAKQRAEIGKVYSESEIKREIKDMVDRGLISKFFGGEYMPKLDKDKINAIARYITLQLNITGSAEKAEAQGLLSSVTNDIMRKIYFTDENGQKLFLRDLLDSDLQNQFADMIRTDIQSSLRNAGELNPYAELQRAYRNAELKYLDDKKKSKEQQEWGKEFPKTYQEALRMRSFAKQKKGVGSDSVQDITKKLAGVVDESGHIHYGKIDEAMKAAATFFEGEAMKLASQRGNLSEDAKITDEALVWSFNPELQEMVNYFIQSRQGREGKALTSEELKIFRDVLKGMRTTLERYNKEYVNGRWVDVDQAAGSAIIDMTRQNNAKTVVSKFLNTKLGKFLNNVYFYEILSPETVIESLEDFKSAGLLKTMYHDIRIAKQKANTQAARMKDPFKQFLENEKNEWKDEKGHKRSFRAKLENKMIKIYGKEINLGEAIYLDMLMKREQSHLGLTENGYITYDDKGAEKTRVKIEDIADAHNQLIEQFDETDKAFLKMAEQFFNETASKIKYDADIKIFGYSNNENTYYVPIIRDRYSRMNGVTDMRQSVGSIVTVYNKSFTKNVVRNNKALEGKNIMRIINDHADGLADYAELYLPLKAFDRIYNHGIVTDGRPTSIRQVLNTQKWNGTEKYLKELFADIQGQSSGDVRNIDKAVAWVRSGWVNSVLGANLKVVATQTTSLGAATQVIDARYVTKCSWMITPGVGYAEGVKAIADRADKYSDIIFARSFDMGALRAQGNIDKVTDLGRKTGSLIEWMDRKVCIALFHAAELQVEAQTGYKVGTEENATRAAKLADEAIYTTQSMDSKAEKSALQRERSEIAKLFSMFTSDTVKNLSHLWGNFMKWNAHRNRVKNGEVSYQAELKKDGRAIKRSLRTMAITGIMIGLITQGFKYLYGKEEKETEDKLKDFALDITSSTLNVFPIVSEFVDKIFLDYDLSVNVLDVVNDTLDAVGGGFDVMGSVFAGGYVSDQKIVKTSANVLKSGASLFGIPVSPVERTVTGLLRRFFPSAIYGYDAMMSNPSYSADLKAAVENGDEELAEHILETIYKNEATGVYSTPELEEVSALYQKGYTSVIPQKIGATVNDVTLDRKQRAQFENIYSQASAKVNELIRSEYYAELDDEQRAKAIKNLYSLYYNRAAAEVAGVEWSNAQAYSHLTGNYAALFAAQAYKSGLAPYKTLRGKEVSVKDQFVDYVENLRLSDTDKLVVLYANGYKDASTKKKMLAYINALSISEDEKAKIAERLGFAVENGKVVEKKEELDVRAE